MREPYRRNRGLSTPSLDRDPHADQIAAAPPSTVGAIVIRLGIIGSNYGRTVLLPAFRADPRCEVVALAGSNAARTAELARKQPALRKALWRLARADRRSRRQAVAIATLPSLQPEIAIAALNAGKPVFAEKPMAADLAAARAMLTAASKADCRPASISISPEIMAWQRAKEMLDGGAVGALASCRPSIGMSRAAPRGCACGTGRPPAAMTAAARSAISSAHCFHYLEWFVRADWRACRRALPACRTIRNCRPLSAMALRSRSGAAGQPVDELRVLSGIGHRIEFFGEDGTLVLHNPTADYMRGFDLSLCASARRALGARSRPTIRSTRNIPDGAHRAGVAAGQPISRCDRERQRTATPGFAEGYRVQRLHRRRAALARSRARWVDIEPAQERQA